MSVHCKEMCFPGICQWGYLKNTLSAPCCFFAICKEEECRKIFLSEETTGMISCCGCLYAFCFSTCIIVYYIGLIFYALFWIIGKFFVFIYCKDCWLKEEYDMDNFRFINAPEVEESKEEKIVKKEVEKIVSKKKQKKIVNFFNKYLKKVEKKIEEEEESDEK